MKPLFLFPVVLSLMTMLSSAETETKRSYYVGFVNVKVWIDAPVIEVSLIGGGTVQYTGEKLVELKKLLTVHLKEQFEPRLVASNSAALPPLHISAFGDDGKTELVRMPVQPTNCKDDINGMRALMSEIKKLQGK